MPSPSESKLVRGFPQSTVATGWGLEAGGGGDLGVGVEDDDRESDGGGAFAPETSLGGGGGDDALFFDFDEEPQPMLNGATQAAKTAVRTRFRKANRFSLNRGNLTRPTDAGQTIIQGAAAGRRAIG